MDGFRYENSSLGKKIKLRRQLLLLLTIAIGGIVIALGIAVSDAFMDKAKLAGKGVIPKRQIQIAWNSGNYALVSASCSNALAEHPMDSYYLTLSGFSSFYIAMAQVSDEEKIKDLNVSVAALRKALLKERVPMRREIHYILGKAYFHLGLFYLDEAVRFLDMAQSEKVRAMDIDEYLALSYYTLGQNEKSIRYFRQALSKSQSDQLSIAAALAFLRAQKTNEAVTLLNDAISRTKDIAAEQKARFVLCDIYIQENAFAKAEEQLSIVLGKDDQSAEAHYQLGIISQKQGDSAKARSEWRKAVKIDPMHQAARLKLSEKTNSPEVHS
jgi:tetratricopeptide (TPR) repeat protein